MLFSSIEFILLFLPTSLFLYFYLNKKKLINVSRYWLIFASLFFYAWWNISYIPLILISIAVNFSLSGFMEGSKENNTLKKLILFFGLGFNVVLLCYFKYMDFFISNINFLFDTNIDLFYLILPLAISFFTLQQIAFLLDSYDGLAHERSFSNYILFVAFFPQLIAGPIVHHKEMMPQFSLLKNKVISYRNIAIGIFIFSIGLFKKVVIADTFSLWVSPGFDSMIPLGFIDAWITSLSYTFQLYFDFSGYADMAIGAALLFNIKIPQNFNSPYKATGMIDFWKRWHITLTNFITTYIYTPMIRSFGQLTFHRSMVATLVAFLISGLWHGASWMFVIFGALNGIGIIINHYWRKYWRKKAKFEINKYLAWFITFNYVNITFIFFRAQDLNSAQKIISGMFSYESNMTIVKSETFFYLFALFLSIGFVTVAKNTRELSQGFKFNFGYLIFTATLLIVSLGSISNVQEFIYFNF